MRCYNHPDQAAVGLCGYCQRGLCGECATLVDDVLACKNHHEGHVNEMLEWKRKGLHQARRQKAGYLRNAIFYGLVGVLFAGFGLFQYRFLGLQAVFLILIGLFLLYAGAANLLEFRKDK